MEYWIWNKTLYQTWCELNNVSANEAKFNSEIKPEIKKVWNCIIYDINKILESKNQKK